MKILGPSTPGVHVKSFNTNRSTTNRTLSKKKRKKSATKRQQPVYVAEQELQLQPGLEIPNITQEYLDKLSEEELQQLLQHQQQLMLLQQQHAPQKPLRLKSAKQAKAKPPKAPPTYQQYYQPYMNTRRKSTGKAKKKGKKAKKAAAHMISDHGGVLMNNYFPALESGAQLIG